MKRICLLFISACFFSIGKAGAQDFSVDELVKLRASNLSNFETAVMAKGYEIADVSSGYDRYVSFKKDNNIIAFGYVRNAHSQSTDTVVVFRTREISIYKALQAQKKENPEHPNITHFISDDSHINHVYIDGKVCLHFSSKSTYGTRYEVRVMPDNSEKYFHYSSLNGSIDW